MASDNDDNAGRAHRTMESQSRHGDANIFTGTRRAQNDVLQRTGAYSFQTSDSNPISRPAPAILETVPNSFSFYHQTPLAINTPCAPMWNTPNDDVWSLYAPWLQQTTNYAPPPDPISYLYHQTTGVPIESAISTIGNMPEPDESRGNQDPATNRFYPEELQPRHGFVPINNNTPMTPRPSPGASLRRLEPRPSQGPQEHLLPTVTGARRFSTTNSFENGYTTTTTDIHTPPSQELRFINWNSERDGDSLLQPRTPSTRRKLTASEKARVKALKVAGGACDACRRAKKRVCILCFFFAVFIIGRFVACLL
jgi:hypothetical protein